jgi:O-antigen/teichoic acid export membrane protein
MFLQGDLRPFRLREPFHILRFPHELLAQHGELEVERPGAFAAHLFSSSLLVMITLRLDYILLGIYRPASDVGIYSIGVQLALPLTFLTGAVNSSLFPRVSAARSGEALRRLAIQAIKMSGIACLAAIAYSVIVPQLAPAILGERYRSSVLLGHILCFRGCLSLLACPLAVVGYGLGLARSYILVNLSQLLVVAMIDWFYLPQFGAIVPALALIANDLIGLLGIAILLWGVRSRLQAKEVTKPTTSC